MCGEELTDIIYGEKFAPFELRVRRVRGRDAPQIFEGKRVGYLQYFDETGDTDGIDHVLAVGKDGSGPFRDCHVGEGGRVIEKVRMSVGIHIARYRHLPLSVYYGGLLACLRSE